MTETKRHLQDLCGDYDDLNVMRTATRKLTAEEAKPNNTNNQRQQQQTTDEKYEHETMKCYVTENNWRD